MFSKLLVLTVSVAAIAGVLLVLRQQRLETAHLAADQMVRVQMMRQRLWTEQARTAKVLPPDELQRQLDAAGLNMSPRGVMVRSDEVQP